MTFTNAPVSRLAVLGVVSASIAASMLDVKHYLYILVDTHLWRYRQFWRLLVYQLAYTNSAEVLLAAMSLYHVRVVERLWGSRKYASYLITVFLMTATVPPLIMAILRSLSAEPFNYMPAGPTPLIFAALAQYHAMVPHVYKYRVATSKPATADEEFRGFTFSDKSYQYLLAFHLALLQWPGSVVGAAVGWLVGHAWRGGVLPAALVSWRLPAWMVGLRGQQRSTEYENLRRRLEGDHGAATGASTGAQAGAAEGQQTDRRRTMGQQIVDQFRYAL